MEIEIIKLRRYKQDSHPSLILRPNPEGMWIRYEDFYTMILERIDYYTQIIGEFERWLDLTTPSLEEIEGRIKVVFIAHMIKKELEEIIKAR